MISVIHELGHAVLLRRFNISITKFELELGADYFGAVGFSPGGVPRDRTVVVAFGGPLAELRTSGEDRAIDRDRSLTPLARALVGPPGVQVYYQDIVAPKAFGKEVFGTDWNDVERLFTEALKDNPELNVCELHRGLLSEAIDLINAPANWNVVTAVALELLALEQVRTLVYGQTVDLTEVVTALIDPKL